MTARVKVKKKTGRHTLYKPEYNRQVQVLAEKGFIDREIAKIFGVTEQTVNNWKIEFPLFFESLKKGKAIADQRVVQGLYERATGYSHPDIHITSYLGTVEKTEIIKHYPPDPTAAIFWLKNRDPANWRDKQEHIIDASDALSALLTEISGQRAGLVAGNRAQVPDNKGLR